MHDESIAYQKHYFVIQELDRAYKFLSYLIKNKMHKPMPRGKNKSVLQEALTISFIVTYAKLFTRNSGFGVLSFNESQFSQEQKNIHNKILKLRHQAFAHISHEIHEVKEHKDFTFISCPFVFISETECVILNDIIKKLTLESSLLLLKFKDYAPQFKYH